MTKKNKLASVILTTMLSISVISTAVVSNQPVYAAAKTSQNKVMSITTYRVKTKSAKLRNKPSSSGKIIINLIKGEEVSVIGKKGSWSQVRYKGNNNRWVKTSDIQKKSTAKSKTRVLTANIVLKSKPNSQGKVLTTLRKGSKVYEVGKASGSWVKVEEGHYTGYVHKKYLK